MLIGRDKNKEYKNLLVAFCNSFGKLYEGKLIQIIFYVLKQTELWKYIPENFQECISVFYRIAILFLGARVTGAAATETSAPSNG